MTIPGSERPTGTLIFRRLFSFFGRSWERFQVSAPRKRSPAENIETTAGCLTAGSTWKQSSPVAGCVHTGIESTARKRKTAWSTTGEVHVRAYQDNPWHEASGSRLPVREGELPSQRSSPQQHWNKRSDLNIFFIELKPTPVRLKSRVTSHKFVKLELKYKLAG